MYGETRDGMPRRRRIASVLLALSIASLTGLPSVAHAADSHIEAPATSTIDLVALDVFFKDQAGPFGSRIDFPAVGQQVYTNVTFALYANTVVNVPIRVQVDGVTLCEGSPQWPPGIWTSSCSVPWTASLGTHTLTAELDHLGTIPETSETNNTTSRQYVLPSWELEAVEVFFLTAPDTGSRVDVPQEGQQLYPHFSYIASGTNDPDGWIWTIYLDGTPLCSYVGSVLRGGRRGWCNQPVTIAQGRFTLSATLDPGGNFLEPNEANNTASRDYLVPLVELSATEIYFCDQPADPCNRVDDPVEGQMLYPVFRFTTTSTGSITVPIRIELDGTTWCEWTGPLAPGSWRYACGSSWTVTGGTHTLRGLLDPDGIVTELNENDNVAQVAFSRLPEVRIEPTQVYADEAASAGSSLGRAAGLAAGVSGRLDTHRLELLKRKARDKGRVGVIVGLDVPFVPEGRLAGAARAEQRATILANQNALLRALENHEVHERARYHFIPFMALDVDSEGLEALVKLPQVVTVEENGFESISMATSNPVIGSPDAWLAGYTGLGQVVAVLDTGVDKNHPFFASFDKVVSEACYSSNIPDWSVSSNCPGGVPALTAPDSGLPCPVNGCHHGTHVAGTVAGYDGSGQNNGVAPDAEIIAIQVFSAINDADYCANQGVSPPCTTAVKSDILNGLQRVFDLRNDFNIVAANLSLGSGQYTDVASCDAENGDYKAAFDSLRSVGIAPIAATGNADSRNSMGRPACVSSAISVGATDDSDNVANFSNIAPFVDLLAPGVDIWSSVPGGGIASLQGTSMATPHVAGAWALVKHAQPTASIEEILEALRATGTSVDDQRSGGSATDMRRINVDQAVQVPPGPRFIVHNGGNGILSVSSIALETPAGWIDWTPYAPFDVPPGESRSVSVNVDFGSAPAGQSTRRLLVESNDADESPYPGGVDVIVTPAGPGPGEVYNLRFTSATKLAWDLEAAAALYHVYRDALSSVSSGAFGQCHDHMDPVLTDTQWDDTEQPTPGEGWVYLVTAEDAGGLEGTLGFASGGSERASAGACP